MNALANSQMEELDKRIKGSGYENKPPSNAIPAKTMRRRARVRAAHRIFFCTNFMMLELLLTRQNEHDQQVVRNCEGLEFLVLDELHTYRGRQGADVAMLVRRVRERLQQDDRSLLCIGTSATMASEGDEVSRQVKVAEVASTLFAIPLPHHQWSPKPFAARPTRTLSRRAYRRMR